MPMIKDPYDFEERAKARKLRILTAVTFGSQIISNVERRMLNSQIASLQDEVLRNVERRVQPPAGSAAPEEVAVGDSASAIRKSIAENVARRAELGEENDTGPSSQQSSSASSLHIPMVRQR